MRTEPAQTPALAPAYPSLGFRQARGPDPLTAGPMMIHGDDSDGLWSRRVPPRSGAGGTDPVPRSRDEIDPELVAPPLISHRHPHLSRLADTTSEMPGLRGAAREVPDRPPVEH